MLAAALNGVDPGEAETLLRRAYRQATTSRNHHLASSAATNLVALLGNQGRLHDALTLADQKIEHTRQAGLGAWTQLGDHAQRLQILSLLGHHGQVLTDLPGLRARMAELPTTQRAANDVVNPWNVRELILDTGRTSALALRRWQQVLDLTDEITTSQRGHGVSAHETALTQFNNYGPLLELGRFAEAEQLLRDCQDVYETVGDVQRLGRVHAARAGNHAEQRAHRLAAVLLRHLTGDTHELTGTLRVLATELRHETEHPDAPALPTTVSEVTGLVDAGDGVRFGELRTALCPDPDTTDQALTDLLATAAALPDQPAEHTVGGHLTQWEPVVAAVAAAATTGQTPPELADGLNQIGDNTDWAALAAALRRVLAGDRDREQLLAGLDDVDTAILAATLDRLPPDLGQDS